MFYVNYISIKLRKKPNRQANKPSSPLPTTVTKLYPNGALILIRETDSK